MEQYKIIKVIGDGTFGIVSKAVNIHTGEVVAIKKMKKKFLSWEECMQLREIKSLKKLTHWNIVKLKEVIRVNDMLHMVFEYVDNNLYQVMKDRSEPFPETEIQSIIYQTLLGVAYIHKNGFFHRDLKPENLLISTAPGSTSSNYIIKICDFGQAREIRSTPPYTEYIATRWYRAPECLLRSNVYNSPMDIFAIGCMMAELYLARPLFPGTSESDQLFKICSVLGTPTQATWPEGLRLGIKVGYQFPNFVATPLSVLIPQASKEAIDLLTAMLRFDPQKRITSAHALAHPYFASFPTKELVSAEPKGSKQTPEFSAVMTEGLGQSYSPKMKKHAVKPKDTEQKSHVDKENKVHEEALNESSSSNKGSQEDPNKSLTKYSLNSSFESVANQSKGFHKTGSSGKSSRSQAKLPQVPPDLDDISDLLESNISTPFSKKIVRNVVSEKPAEDKKSGEKPKEKSSPETDKEEKKAVIKRRADRDRPRFDSTKKEEDKVSSPQLGGAKIAATMWDMDSADSKGTWSEPVKPRRQLQQKSIIPPINVAPTQFDEPAVLSGESNFSYHKKHLGAAVVTNTGVTGSGLRAAARDTYKKEVQHSFMDHNTPKGTFSIGGMPVIPQPGDTGSMAASARPKIEDSLLYMPIEQSATEGYKPPSFGYGGTQISQQPVPGIAIAGQPAGGAKYQFNYGRYKYQQ